MEANEWLFKDGYSDYTIVIANDASVSERTAAREFQSIVRQVSGAELPITLQPTRKSVYIGWTAESGEVKPAVEDEAFTYKTIGCNLFIYGGCERGTMYGVFAFLERELGVHWYTSDYTKVPKMKQYELGALNHTERPAIASRLDYYNDAVGHNDWASHNMINNRLFPAYTKYGHMTASWGTHSFSLLIPPAVYFKVHPEYFGVYKGKRHDNTQLCLSNEEMCKELIKNLEKVIQEKPDYWCYDVSQNDNNLYCECDKCKEFTLRYGGHSGLMVWFVNKVAHEIKKVYPDVMIGTFAYHYTRQAPTSDIRPADNVVIKLCDIECCMAHPLDECEQNKEFLRDMENWRRITKNIYIWDYTTGFRHYLMPFPNFDVLARNYQYFRQSNVIGILELGSWNAPWSEFSELKQWLIAKLLWNPCQDTDSLANLFINDYYGIAAPYVRKYYDLCRRQVTPGSHFTVKIEWDTELYTDKFMDDASKLLNKAFAASRNKETQKRTNRLAAQIYYMQLRRQTTQSLTNGTANKLREIISSDSTLVREYGPTLGKLIEDLSYY